MNAVSRSVTPHPTDIGRLSWLNQAEPGDAIEYHRGFLALNRSHQSSTLRERDRQALCRLANLAMRLADQSLVHLVQHRICRDRFSYIAIARQRPNSTT